MQMAFTTLSLEVADGVGAVMLNRPKALNAMNRAFWQEMVDLFTEIDETPAIRVVVLAGAGKHFTAGLDLTEFGQLGQAGKDEGRRREQLRRQILEMQESFTAIERCRVPVLAAIHGACIGGGIDMISACDVRYAATDAFFSIHEINIGMTADVGTLQRLPHLMPAGLVRELAYTGRRMPAEEAAACGLVTRVYESREAMLTDVRRIALEIAAKSPLAVAGSKEMLTYARDHAVADGLNYIATWNAGMLLSDDLTEALAAQREKRSPRFADLARPPRFIRRRA
jgi:enoyl-CoA hydratase